MLDIVAPDTFSPVDGLRHADPSKFSNAGTISVNAATLNLRGTFTQAQLGTVTRSGGTINLKGTLDNVSATLNVGTGTALGTLTLAANGTIRSGTVADSGSGLASFGGDLDGVAYQGTLDLTPDGSLLSIKDGITFSGPGGSGPAVINLGTSQRNGGKTNEIDVLGNQTLDNVTIDISAGFTTSIIRTDDSTLTLGSNLTVNAAGTGSGVEFTDLPSHTNAARGGSIVNAGTINAGSLNSNAPIIFDSASFINQGTITVSNNALVEIVPHFSWSNSGTINVQGGTLVIGALDPAVTGTDRITLAQLGTISHTGGTVEFQGALDNTGTTLNVGTGSALGTLRLQFGGSPFSASIFNGTIHDAGSGLVFQGAILDGVTYQGTVDLSAAGSNSLFVKDGITLTDPSGTGSGLINLTGSGSSLYVEGVTTLDNANVNIGSAGGDTVYVDEINDTSSDGSGNAPALTFGANLTVNQTGASASLNSRSDFQRGGIINTGTINADFNGGNFTIDPASFTNQGTIHSSNGDSVAISSPNVTNTGKLWADGGNVVVSSPVTGAGTDEITGAGVMEFAGTVASGQTVTFDANSTGTLKLDNSPGFAGTVSGLALGNYIDLTDVQFVSLQAPTYTPNANNTGGTLTVTDGQHTANIALLGQYMAGSFATSADGHGGTLITDPPSTQPPALTPPHP